MVRAIFSIILFQVLLLTTNLCQANSIKDAQLLEKESRELYQTGNFPEAKQILNQAIQIYLEQKANLQLAVAYGNLASICARMGEYEEAKRNLLSSFDLLASEPLDRQSSSYLKTWAGILEIEGKIELDKGNASQALTSYERAEQAFVKIQDGEGIIRTEIGRAWALQSLGFYRRAISQLEKLLISWPKTDNSTKKIIALRSLGNALWIIGENKRAKETIENSLNLARDLQMKDGVASAQLILGNIARALNKNSEAKNWYQLAAERGNLPITRIQAQLNQLSLVVQERQWSEAKTLWQEIEKDLPHLPLNRTSLYAQINYARNLIESNIAKIPNGRSQLDIARLLKKTQLQARKLGDSQSEAYALTNLAFLYETNQQWEIAQKLSERALILSKQNNNREISYEINWQLGRIFTKKQESERAIAAYSEAISNIESLKNDLVAIDPQVQFSFQENVEPIYRQLVELLIELQGKNPQPKNLENARTIIESLQIAQIENFLQESCLKLESVSVEKIDRQAAVLYPIILSKQLAVVLSLPGQPLRYYTTPVTQERVENLVEKLYLGLTQRNNRRFLPLSQTVYDWLIRPVEKDLQNSRVETLVFVLDGALRNIPMGALHDRQQYLIEKYNIAIAPALQLLDTKLPIATQPVVLTAGISESNLNLNPLPYVEEELKRIGDIIPTHQLLNKQFTNVGLSDALRTNISIVHLATHGQFSSQLELTFLAIWNDRLKIDRLRNLLQDRQIESTYPIDLLVLSACETAAGDKRAALGLAGVAVKSGARTTLATLWQVNDRATYIFMEKFYQELIKPNVSKASALKKAQQYLLEDPQYGEHPYYWAAYVLVGNWR
jgi:CHAT domain-containing protein/tetratricopeptide (TPR) repeat protein